MDEDRINEEGTEAEPSPETPETESSRTETPETDSVELETEPSGLPSHVASALCYVLSFVSGAIFLLLETEDKSVRFHAFQSILVGAVIAILEIGIAILGLIPPLGWLLSGVLHWLVGVGWILLSLFLMIKAYGGEEYALPYVGPRALRLARPYD